MVHCDPAPPHPEPGEVAQAICWTGVPLEQVLVVVVVATVLIYALQRRQE